MRGADHIIVELEYVRTSSCLELGEAFEVAGELFGIGGHGVR
jgi:hypothetical protein